MYIRLTVNPGVRIHTHLRLFPLSIKFFSFLIFYRQLFYFALFFLDTFFFSSHASTVEGKVINEISR